MKKLSGLIITAFITNILLSSCLCNDDSIKIEWTDNIDEEFEFIEEWDYPEGVYRNEYRQLICDGICPPETERMIDKEGKIIEDSIHVYYQYVDTTHMYRTIDGISNNYEWTKTTQIVAYEISDTVKCYTMCSASNHSSLELKIIGNKCFARIVLNSVTSEGTLYFPNTDGYIKIDKPLFEKGILKAEFDLGFLDPEYTDIELWWKGLIYTKIRKDVNNII